MIHRLLFAALVAGTAATAATPLQAGSQFEYVSQSVIAMRGLPARRKAKPVAKAVAPPVADAPMTAEERRILRYGLEEETAKQHAEAERGETEEETGAEQLAATVAEPEPKPTATAPKTVAAAAPAEFDASNTKVVIEAASAEPTPRRKWESPAEQKVDRAKKEKFEEAQRDAEAPPVSPRLAEQLRSSRNGTGVAAGARPSGDEDVPLALGS